MNGPRSRGYLGADGIGPENKLRGIHYYMSRMRVQGIEIEYDDVGRGPAFLLLHGHPFDRRMWNPQVAAISNRFRCIVPDLCGYGRSEARPGRVLLDEMALDLLHLLDGLQIRQTVVCGLSMGVQIALDLVRLAPDRVVGLALAAGSAREESAEGVVRRRALAKQLEEEGTLDHYVDENLLKFFSPRSAAARPEAVAFLDAIMRGCSAVGAAAALRGRAERRDHRNALGNIAASTVVICGDSDAFTSVDEARELASGIPGATLVLLPEVGHMPNLEQPDDFNRALIALGARAYSPSA